ncbi:MAG: ATP-binding cassette domain-containing protein [Bacteroidota bacterium]
MSEQVLRILLRIFASLALVDGATREEREVVFQFLEDHLNNNDVPRYMDLFEQMLRTRDMNIREYCERIAEEMTQKQQFIIVLYLLELIHADEVVSAGENAFLRDVIDAFVFENDEAERMIAFAEAERPEELSGQHVLLVADAPPEVRPNTRFLEAPVEGELLIVSVGNGILYLAKYLGGSYLQINHHYMPPGRVKIFSHGSVISLPQGNSLYFSDVIRAYLDLEETEKVTLSCHDLDFEFPNGNMGLRGIDLKEESGQMVAIMGASGSGKSTLLNVLNGNYRPSRGKVLINGRELHGNLDDFKGMIGYVPQDDLLIEELTVYQNLYFNAKLVHRDKSPEELDVLVMKVLTDLGLTQTRDLRVGNPLQKTISGGQRKRLNIGLELLRTPAIIFFDEPTSGLSSRDSENIMDLLKELTLKGKLIFVVIHQPSSDIFKLFDSLFILDTGGYPIYYGNPIEAVMYFKRVSERLNHGTAACPECGNINPEQIFNIIETRVINEYGIVTNKRRIGPKRWHAVFLKHKREIRPSPPNSQASLEEFALKNPSWWRQFNVFLRRDLLAKLGNKQYLTINIIQAPLLAFILAVLVRHVRIWDDPGSAGEYLFGKNENIPAFFFMSIVVALFTGMTMSAEEIFRDRKILKRENFLNLSRSGYLLAKISILFSLSGLQMLAFVLISGLILALPGLYFPYWVLLFSLGCFAIMLALNISATFNSAVTIYILIPLLLIPQLILSGTVVKFEKLNPILSSTGAVPVVADLMASRWAYEALMVKYFKDNAYQSNFFAAEQVASTATYRKDYWVPEIEAMLDFCAAHYNSEESEMREKVRRRFAFMQAEVKRMRENMPAVKLPCGDEAFSTEFTRSQGDCVTEYVDLVRQAAVLDWKNAMDRRDELDRKLAEQFASRAEYARFISQQHNESIDKLLRNADSGTRIQYSKKGLIRRFEPVYHRALYFDAHFYAPSKQVLGLRIDTFWYNVLVIWVMTLTLYLTLYLNFFSRLINRFGRVRKKPTPPKLENERPH